MSETLVDSAMRELKVARDEIAEAHKALDELGAPGQWQMRVPDRLRALADIQVRTIPSNALDRLEPI